MTVLGSGYVGLVAAAGFADAGHQVQCVDVDQARVTRLQAGEIPFFEPGLREVVERATRGRRLTFGTEIDQEHRSSEVHFIAVGTPPRADGSADVSDVLAAARTLRQIALTPAVIGIKSTVPVGTCDAVQATVDSSDGPRLRVASVPEFLKEGTAIADFMKPDRVIIGVGDEEAERVLRELYRPLQLSSERLLVMDRRSSELSKYAANAMLAARISFMNEMARLCDALGADVHAIRRAVGSDRRIGPHFLYAGPGFGGSCFHKDISALTHRASDVGVTLEMVEAVHRANQNQQRYVRDQALDLLEGGLPGKVVAIWGVAFKAGTDDVRETPAWPLVKALVEGGATVRIHDPEAAHNFLRAYGVEAEVFDSEYDAARGADLVALMTEWRHLRNPDFARLRGLLRTPVLFDARNIWTTFHLDQKGFRYRGVGTRSGRG